MISQMKGIRHLPLAVLLLMLMAAGAAMGIGWLLSRQERVEMVERDQKVVVDFAGRFGTEIEGLEKNLERTLLELCGAVEENMSDRRLRELAETFSGVRQVSMVKTGRLGKGFSLERSVDLGAPFPLPRVGKEGKGELALKQLESPGMNRFWKKGTIGQWYFVSRQIGNPGWIVVLGIDEGEILKAMEGWLGKWAGIENRSLNEEGWSHRVVSPAGLVLADQGGKEVAADTVFPIGGRWGAWEVLVWNERRTVVEYQQSVLLTAGGIALVLLIAGVVAFTILRRSVALAMQRVSFVNQVSHELRTPLTNIMLNLDLAKDSVEGNGMATRRLGLMGEELGRLQRLLENVLTFSGRGETKPVETEDLELESEIRRALKSMEPSLKRQGVVVEFDFENGLVARADGDALAQILGNLLSNVAKYGEGGGQLLVKTLAGDGVQLIQVSDAGPGVARRDRERIFKPFLRLNDRVNEGVSGSGLGLAISRDLAESMGGSLRCVDRPDGKEGACFELGLPKGESKAEIVPFETKVS